MTETELFRNNHLVDPALAIWGWEVPVYLFLGGVAAGLMIIAALAGRGSTNGRPSKAMRWMPLLVPVALSIGMLALFLDLEQKVNVLRFYTAFRVTSPMSWGAWILLLIYPAALLLWIMRLTEDELRAVAATKVMKRLRFDRAAAAVRSMNADGLARLEMVNLILGVALGAYTGILLGTLGARPLWSSVMLGPLFLVSGFSTGAALLLLLPISDEEHRLVRNWDLAAIAVECGLLALFFIGLFSGGGAAGRAAAALFFGGPYTAAFWSLVVGAGLFVPFVVEAYEAKAKVRATVVAPILLLCGGLALRWIVVMAGQTAI